MRAPFYADDDTTLLLGDALEVARRLPDESVDCIVTSPPYFGLRAYGVPETDWPETTYTPMPGLPEVTIPAMRCCLGSEPEPNAFIGHLVALFTELHRALAKDGTLWVNLDDSYAGKANAGETFDRHRGGGHKAGIVVPQRNMLEHAPYKSQLGIPQRFSLAMIAAGWGQRNVTVWNKPNAMPESMEDRLSRRWEPIFLFTRSARYHFDLNAIRIPHTMKPQRRPKGHKNDAVDRAGQPANTFSTLQREEPGVDGHPLGRNPGDVWDVCTVPFPGEHRATMPPELALRMVTAGCKPGGVVLDPFSGSGTTGWAAHQRGHRYIGIDASEKSHREALKHRLGQGALLDVV